PVQVIYPGKDHVTSNATFHRLQDALQQRAQPSSILLYPGADHGFMHESGAANEFADRHSRPQIAAFLAASLAAPR
ncbi:MAG: dienelactone hydrolase family protein, partial [Stellaceae bacterium]